MDLLHRCGGIYAQEHREDGVVVSLRAPRHIVKSACQAGARLLDDENV
jgi:hypothetical protein